MLQFDPKFILMLGSTQPTHFTPDYETITDDEVNETFPHIMSAITGFFNKNKNREDNKNE